MRRTAALWVTGLVAAAAVHTAAPSVAIPVDPLAPGPYRVTTAEYTLGDSAFRVPGFTTGGEEEGLPLAPIELTGTVHVPRARGGGRHPLVVLSHGSWITCADRAAKEAATAAEEEQATIVDPTPPEDGEPAPTPGPGQRIDPDRWKELERIIEESYAKLIQWPCAAGTPPLPSHRGYDYLARHLASHGFVVVSVSANGVNAGALGETADMARAAVVNRHLALWAQLDRTGGGPLAGRFTRPGTGTAVTIDVRGRLDLGRVGTVGHSRGGRGAMWHAAEANRAKWPSGVKVGAVVTLGAAGAFGEPGSAEAVPYLVTRTPFLTWIGTCDGATSTQGEDYVKFALGRTRKAMTRLTVHGANHNFLNTEWSPDSGQVDASDDAERTGPGRCRGETTGPLPTRPDGTFDPDAEVEPEVEEVRQLGEDAERQVSSAYVSAYLRRHLMGDHRFDPMLTGRQTPLAGIADVDALRIRPARR